MTVDTRSDAAQEFGSDTEAEALEAQFQQAARDKQRPRNARKGEAPTRIERRTQQAVRLLSEGGLLQRQNSRTVDQVLDPSALPAVGTTGEIRRNGVGNNIPVIWDGQLWLQRIADPEGNLDKGEFLADLVAADSSEANRALARITAFEKTLADLRAVATDTLKKTNDFGAALVTLGDNAPEAMTSTHEDMKSLAAAAAAAVEKQVKKIAGASARWEKLSADEAADEAAEAAAE